MPSNDFEGFLNEKMFHIPVFLLNCLNILAIALHINNNQILNSLTLSHISSNIHSVLESYNQSPL